MNQRLIKVKTSVPYTYIVVPCKYGYNGPMVYNIRARLRQMEKNTELKDI